jgi:hypothetical protein
MLRRGRTLGIDKTCNKPFTPEEDEIIRRNVDRPWKEYKSLLPGRKYPSISVRKKRLGIRQSIHLWTKAEDKILHELVDAGMEEWMSALPGRNEGSIYNRRLDLGITTPPDPWTEDEDEILRENRNSLAGELVEMLPGRTRAAIKQRRFQIGVTPDSKWHTQDRVVAILRELDMGEVIAEAMPDWLGNQRLDAYLPEHGLAVEYHGRQHYEPIEFFARYQGIPADELLKNIQERDARKRKLCRERGVTLIEIPYTATITAESIREKILEARPDLAVAA